MFVNRERELCQPFFLILIYIERKCYELYYPNLLITITIFEFYIGNKDFVATTAQDPLTRTP